MKGAARSIFIGQLFLYTGLAVCVLLRPAGLAVNAGISYYGIYRQTFLPYAAGLLGAAYFAMRAMDELLPDEKKLRVALKIYVPLIIGIVITPYAASKWLDYLHTAFGSALFFLQLTLSCWLARRLHYIWWGVMLVVVELAAGIASALYLIPTHGFLLQAQVIFQVAFGVLLVLSLPGLASGERKASAGT
ncbi:MAG TPA: hypothetical protein VGM08_01265 [Candidatus Saccharimonadales bacterium]|jgi:hypothetical protein